MSFDTNGYLGIQINMLRTEHYKPFSEYYDFAFKINAFSKNLMRQLEIHTNNAQELLVSALLTKIANSFQASILLISYGLDSDAKSIIRTQLEALFKLVVIANDSSFALKFAKTYYTDKMKLLNVIINDNGETFNKEKFNKKDIIIERNELNKIIENEDILKMDVKQLAEKADLKSYYNLVYRQLCGDVHSNMNSLDKYFLTDDKKEITGLSDAPYIKDTKMVIITGIVVMIRAMDNCCTLFGIIKDKELGEMFDKIKELDKDALKDIT